MSKRKNTTGDSPVGGKIDIDSLRAKYFSEDQPEGIATSGTGDNILAAYGYSDPSESLRQIVARDLPGMDVMGPEQIAGVAHEHPDAVSINLASMRRAAFGQAGFDVAESADANFAQAGASAGGPSGIVVVTPHSDTDTPQRKLEKAKAVVVVDGQIIAHQG